MPAVIESLRLEKTSKITELNLSQCSLQLCLELELLWKCTTCGHALKKDVEIRKTLFHYRNNTFQLPSLLLSGKKLFQQKEDFVRK